jgi:hypothetical protein
MKLGLKEKRRGCREFKTKWMRLEERGRRNKVGNRLRKHKIG